MFKFNMGSIVFAGYEPVRFWGYTSFTTKRILSIDCSENKEMSDWFKKSEQELIDLFKSCKIKAHLDNKIVFELQADPHYYKDKPNIFIGFYDWGFSIGLGRGGDDWISPSVKER